MKAGKREQIEQYMKKEGILILALQETYINYSSIEQRKNYTFYFSGDPSRKNAKGETHHYTTAGVGFVINNELKNYITDIEPINDRIIAITFGYAAPLTFICNYSRPATKTSTTEQKRAHYAELVKIQRRKQSEGPTYTIGDFNARIQKKLSPLEKPVGPFTFDKNNDTMNRRTPEDLAKENRSLLIGHCIQMDCQIANTFFEKPDEKTLHF